MAKSYFKEKERQPAEAELTDVLQGAKSYWEQYVAYIDELVPGASCLWKYYGKAWGWCLVYIDKKKNLLYVTPSLSCFYISFNYNDKNREMAMAAGLPDEVLKTIESGKINPAGHTFDIEVRTEEDLELAKGLLDIKCNKMTK